MFGSDVRQCSSTQRPLSQLEAGRRSECTSGTMPTPTTTMSAAYSRSPQTTLRTRASPANPSIRRRCNDPHALAFVPREIEIGDQRPANHALHRPVRHLEHGDVEPELAHGRGRLEPDVARADDDQAARTVQSPPGWRRRRPSCADSGCPPDRRPERRAAVPAADAEQQLVPVQFAAVGETHALCGAVDRRDAHAQSRLDLRLARRTARCAAAGARARARRSGTSSTAADGCTAGPARHRPGRSGPAWPSRCSVSMA